MLDPENDGLSVGVFLEAEILSEDIYIFEILENEAVTGSIICEWDFYELLWPFALIDI